MRADLLTPLVSIDAALPALWFAGHTRSPHMQAAFAPGADLQEVTVRLKCDAFPESELARELLIRSARAGQRSEVFPLTLTPVKAGEFRLELLVTARIPRVLTQTWRAELLIKVRNPPRSMDDLRSMLSGLNMSLGEKALMGQLVTDAHVHIGHQITVNAGFDQAFETALRNADEEDRSHLRRIEPSTLQDHCESWTNHHHVRLAAIPAGKFQMGASADDAEADTQAERQREVSLTFSYWMSALPVTRGQYRAVMGSVPAAPFASHEGDSKAVTQVSWQDATAFCERLTVLEREEKALPAGFAYRLPTEAEWEHACRAGSTAPRHGTLEETALVAETGHRFAEPGGRKPNAWGLHDMLGLVHEWCHDVHAPYRPLKTVNPVNERPSTTLLNSPTNRVVRGGSYQDAAVHARASARLGAEEKRMSGRIGFRVVLARPLVVAEE